MKKPSLKSIELAKTGCSEADLAEYARDFAKGLGREDWILLEGPLGAGKSTFAKYLLEALGVKQGGRGSPTFAISHEYESKMCAIVHIDLYRLEHEEELEHAGILDQFWAGKRLVICEWSSKFPALVQALRDGPIPKGKKLWEITLSFSDKGDEFRDIVRIGA